MLPVKVYCVIPLSESGATLLYWHAPPPPPRSADACHYSTCIYVMEPLLRQHIPQSNDLAASVLSSAVRPKRTILVLNVIDGHRTGSQTGWGLKKGRKKLKRATKVCDWLSVMVESDVFTHNLKGFFLSLCRATIFFLLLVCI